MRLIITISIVVCFFVAADSHAQYHLRLQYKKGRMRTVRANDIYKILDTNKETWRTHDVDISSEQVTFPSRYEVRKRLAPSDSNMLTQPFTWAYRDTIVHLSIGWISSLQTVRKSDKVIGLISSIASAGLISAGIGVTNKSLRLPLIAGGAIAYGVGLHFLLNYGRWYDFREGWSMRIVNNAVR